MVMKLLAYLIKKIYNAFPRVPLPQHLWDVDDVQQLYEDLGTAKARVEGCSSFLKAAIRWSASYGANSSGSPELHIMLAEYMYSESPEVDISKVTYHFVRGNDPKKFASALVNFFGKVNLYSVHFFIPCLVQLHKFLLRHAKLQTISILLFLQRFYQTSMMIVTIL